MHANLNEMLSYFERTASLKAKTMRAAIESKRAEAPFRIEPGGPGSEERGPDSTTLDIRPVRTSADRLEAMDRKIRNDRLAALETEAECWRQLTAGAREGYLRMGRPGRGKEGQFWLSFTHEYPDIYNACQRHGRIDWTEPAPHRGSEGDRYIDMFEERMYR